MKSIIEHEVTFENNSDMEVKVTQKQLSRAFVTETQWSKIRSTVKSTWQAKQRHYVTKHLPHASISKLSNLNAFTTPFTCSVKGQAMSINNYRNDKRNLNLLAILFHIKSSVLYATRLLEQNSTIHMFINFKWIIKTIRWTSHLTEQLFRPACTQPDRSLRIQHAVSFSCSRSFSIARSTFSSLRMHGEYFAPRWIKSACGQNKAQNVTSRFVLHSKRFDHQTLTYWSSTSVYNNITLAHWQANTDGLNIIQW